MTGLPLILVCDHRGEGLLQALQPLESMGFAIEESPNLGHTRQRILRRRPALVVLEPLSRGSLVELELLSAARAGSSLPVLLVAAPEDPLASVMATRALDSGPWDLIYRNAPIEEFLMRIQRLQGQADHLRELDEMRYAAVHDDRTSLLRPVPFSHRLTEHFSAAQRHHFNLALALLDLDDFGRVNKDFDHTVGDMVIDRVGGVVRDNLRTEDVGGRIGGDEFAIVLPYTERVDVARVVSRLREQVHGLTGPFDGSGKEIHISASIGFETFDGVDVDSVEALRRHAEVALREAKQQGGNRALYFRQLRAAKDVSQDA